MTGPGRCDWEMRTTLPATLAAAEALFAEFRRRSERMGTSSTRFAAELALREAVTNAVVHGCQEDPAKRVHCVLRWRGRCLTIAVRDDGAGFDWRGAWGREAENSACSGRGMAILRKYVNRTRFNDRGNAVTMIKRF